MTPEAVAAVVESWRVLETAGGNRYANTFSAIIRAMPADDPENLAAAVAAIARGLPELVSELGALIIATAEALASAQEDFDAAFDRIATTLGEPGTSPDILDYLNGVAGLNPEDLTDPEAGA